MNKKLRRNKQPLAVPVVQSRTQTFEGPLPPPALLEKYNTIVPNAAERILLMAESEARHRQQQEATINQANIAIHQSNTAYQQKHIQLIEIQTRSVIRGDILGQVMGFVLGMASLGGSI